MSAADKSRERQGETGAADTDGRPTLRFITCGSVDDGKSTLIGRLLYDSRLLTEDQLATLEAESRTMGTTGGGIDFALLVDGLQAEREQGITIDVAYRFFATDNRRFIVADTPGHEQYTRNMATAASTAELAVILIDARKGVLTQTRRHTYIVSLFGIRHVILAVNKMDLVGCDAQRFNQIAAEFRTLAAGMGLNEISCIPVSALGGDNVFTHSDRMPWYTGPTLMKKLETVEVATVTDRPFRMPVQWVNRPNADFRGYAGRIADGSVRPGDTVTVYPSCRSSQVARIVTADGDLDEAATGRSVILTLADEIDISRGDLLASGEAPLITDQISAHLIWLDESSLLPGRRFLMKTGSRTVGASVTTLKYRVNVNTMEHLAATTLTLNEIGAVNLGLDRPIACDTYVNNRETGSFIFINPFTNRTAGAGIIDFALRRAGNIPWQDIEVTKDSRSALKHQRPFILWFTGLSGSGKSTIANLVEKRLIDLGLHTYLIDGENLRHGLSRDLGFTPEARVENVRRASEVAKLFVDAGVIVLVSLISPFRDDRAMARAMVSNNEFVEIFVSTPLEECERRDRKGLYRLARLGRIPNFTAINSPYEPPEAPDLVLDTMQMSAEDASGHVLSWLLEHGFT